MLGMVLAALVGLPAPQDTATLDAPVYANTAYGVSLPRPFDDWVFEPGTGERTTTVIFHPRASPLREQLWGALVLTSFSSPVALDRVADQRVQGTWRRQLGRSFDALTRDSLTVAGLPAIRVVLVGAIGGVPVEVEEYMIARDSDLILLQLRTPRNLPRDSIEAGYGRVLRGLTIRLGAPSPPVPRAPMMLAESLATARVVPGSPWQASAYDALIRFDSAAARADFAVRVELLNGGGEPIDSASVWLWPALTLDSVRAGSSGVVPRITGSVVWVGLPAEVAPGERAIITYFYHVQAGAVALPPALMGVSSRGAYAMGEWLPRPQPALDSAGQYAPTTRARLTLRFDLPEGWQAVAQGRLVSEALFQGRHRMTWRSAEVATTVAAFAFGPYQVASGFPGDVRASLWLTPEDSLSTAAMDSLIATVQAAWIFCSRAFGPLPIADVAVATADVPEPRGFAGLVVLDHRTAALFESSDSGAALPAEATDAVFTEVARTWWGNSVAVAGPGSGWMTEAFPAWTALAARGVLEGDTVRQRLVRAAEATWRATADSAGDRPLGPISPVGGRAALLESKGVAAIEAMRRAIGEARFREALLTLTREHRNGWLTLDDVFAAAGADGAAVLRTFLF